MTAQTTEAQQTSPTDWVWLLLPYAMLLAGSAYAGFSGSVSAADLPRVIVTSVLLIAWHTYWTVGHRHWLERALLPMTVYYLGLIAACTVLLQISPSYLALFLACYAMAFVALPGAWAYVGLVLATVVPFAFSTALSWGGLNLVITVGGLALAAVIGWSIRRLEAETAARRAALGELADAHTELTRALADNLELRDLLVAEARESGAAAERSRIAAEIHDTLAAALTGIVSQLEAIDAQAPQDESLRSRVQLSMELARDALREARQSIHALRPAVLDGRGLPGALSVLVSEFERSGSLQATFRVSGSPAPLPEEVEDTLVRIAREALTNIRRHAGARHVHLTLSYLGESVALDIVDDGAGFDSAQRASGGHGLDLMTERATGQGGTLDLQTTPGSGTTITATLPATHSAQARDD